jgi:Ca2+-binding EF-hand superfamily protein
MPKSKIKRDESGSISNGECSQLLKELKIVMSYKEVDKLFDAVDENKNEEIDFDGKNLFCIEKK